MNNNEIIKTLFESAVQLDRDGINQCIKWAKSQMRLRWCCLSFWGCFYTVSIAFDAYRGRWVMYSVDLFLWVSFTIIFWNMTGQSIKRARERKLWWAAEYQKDKAMLADWVERMERGFE